LLEIFASRITSIGLKFNSLCFYARRATLQVNRKLEDTSIVQCYHFQLVQVCHSHEIEEHLFGCFRKGKIHIPRTVCTKCMLKMHLATILSLDLPAAFYLVQKLWYLHRVFTTVLVKRENKMWYFSDISLLMAAQMNS